MDEKERARRIAANLTAARMYTCKEIYDRLIRKKISADTAEEVVGEFAAAGVLDDSVYAKFYIEDALRLQAKGMFRIRRELMQKGISGSIIDAAAAETADEIDTKEALRTYLSPRLMPSDIRSRRDLEKLKAKLLRRGYSVQDISACLDDYDFKFEDTE